MTVSAGDGVPPWDHLNGLDAYEITRIPRPGADAPGGGSGSGGGPVPAGYAARTVRGQSLAPMARRGPFAYAWTRASEGGDIRMLAAGAGMRAGQREPGGHSLVPLSYPAGAMGRPLGRGGAAEALDPVASFVPVEVTADALLNLVPDGQVPSGAGPSLEDGFLRIWRGPFALAVIACPVPAERHRKLLETAALSQLKAQRHDTPQAQLAQARRRARHEEFRKGLQAGLWDIWALAGGESKDAAAEAAALLAASLDLRGLGFGLTERRDLAASLRGLLGAPPEPADGREHGPLARETLEMFGGDDPRALSPGAAPGPPAAAQAPSFSGTPFSEASITGAQPEDGQAGVTRDDLGRIPPGGGGWEPTTFTMPMPPGVAGGEPLAAPTGPGYGSGYGSAPPGHGAVRGYGSAPGYGAPPGPPALPPEPARGTGPAPAWLGQGGAPPTAPPLSAPAMQPDFSDPVPEWPVTAGSDLLAALTPVPAREIPGVRLVLQPGFDVTPETDPAAADAVTLGTVLDGARLPAGPFAVTLDSLNRHLFVCGATGSGKSQTVRNILERLTEKKVPWLVIEPAKAEYRRMAARLPDREVIVIRPGDPDAVAAGINPLEPALGPDGTRYPLQVHADLVRGLFLAAFQAEEPFPQVLAQALERVYREAGWDLVSGESAVEGASYPDLSDLQAAALKVVDEVGYGREVRDNIRGFVSVRIGALQSGTTGRFLSGRFPVDFGTLLDSNVVLEIEDAGDDQDKAFLIGAVLVRLNEFLRLRERHEAALRTARPAGSPGGEEGTAGESPPVAGLRHVTVIEEAHRLLRQPPEGTGAGAAAKAVEMFADVLAEIRAYGEGIIIAEQIPTKLISDAVKNTAVKLMHRLPAKDDREAVGLAMNMKEPEQEFVTTLLPGEAAAFADGMDFPVLIRLPDGSARETAGARVPSAPARLVTGERPACPEDCATTACTLRELSASAKIAAESRLALWAELTVVAHLTGNPTPKPGEALAEGLQKLGRRRLDCAIAASVTTAVAARIPALSARIAGPALAAHCAAAMRGFLDEGGRTCGRDELQWIAPSYFWHRVLSGLRIHGKEHPGEPHPQTESWEAACEESLPGKTCAEQTAVAQQRHAAARKDRAVMKTVLYGNRAAGVLERAVGGTASDPAWTARLRTALTVFDGCQWPLRHLVPGPKA